MNIVLITTVLIITAAAFGIWRTWREPVPRRVWRIALQLVAATLLYLLLFPPHVDQPFTAGTLVVLTPSATQAQIRNIQRGVATVALPGFAAPDGIERVPDLGTALRRHADATRVRVVGRGLTPRDLDAARGVPIELDAAPLPRGIVEVASPARARAGAKFDVVGRVEGDTGGRIGLRGPAGEIIASATLADDGAFALDAQARTPGNDVFALRALGRDGAVIDTLQIAIAVDAGDDLRVLVLAGAPDPELKYLRRWATDAGIRLSSRLALSDGIAMQDGSAAAPTAADFAQSDLVIVDERAWKALDASTRTALTDAVHAGLGLLLRVTGPLPDGVADDWNRFGFRIAAASPGEPVTLARQAASSTAAVALTRQPIAVEVSDAAPLVQGSDGAAVALWRNAGQGRVAIWWLADSYRLSLAGETGAFGTLWSDAIATIARARAEAMPLMPVDARVDQRSVLCAVADDAVVEQPDATRVALLVDANAGAQNRCAAYWPTQPGWHTLISAGKRWPFAVRADDEGIALAAASDAQATRMLAGAHNGDASESTGTLRSVPAPRWPFFIAWLAAIGCLWWLERTRVPHAIIEQ